MPKSRWALVLLLIFVPCLAAPTCGGGVDDKLEGEPCTRRTECQSGLDCVGGVCSERHDAARNDGGSDAGDASVPDGS